MNNIFECCAELEKIDLSKFKAKIKSMEYMFSDYQKLKNVNIYNIDSTEANIHKMFRSCTYLEKENVNTKDQNILDKFDNLSYGDVEDIGEVIMVIN